MAGHEFIFHIGAHKTGTTYVQAALTALAPRLREHGVLVPNLWHQHARQPGHHQLAQRLSEAAFVELAQDFAGIRQAGFDRVVISSEALTTIDDNAIALLARLVGDDEARFVFHCRRPSDLLPSNWQETVRQGATRPLPAFVADALGRGTKGSILNFGLKLAPFARAFGRNRIDIVSYSAVMDAERDLVEHFVSRFLPGIAITADEVRAATGESRNASWPFWRIELLRALNALAVARGKPPSAGIRMWLTRYGDDQGLDLGLDAIREFLGKGRRVLNVDDTHPVITELCRRLWQDWGDRVVEPRGAEGLFTPKTRAAEYVAPNFVTRPRAAALIAHVYQVYLDNPLPARSARAR
jgi:hypothetical protein